MHRFNRGTIGKRDDTLGAVIYVPNKPGYVYVSFEDFIWPPDDIVDGKWVKEFPIDKIIPSFRLIYGVPISWNLQDGFLYPNIQVVDLADTRAQLAAWRRARDE